MTVTRLLAEMPEHEREGWLAYYNFEAGLKRNG